MSIPCRNSTPVAGTYASAVMEVPVTFAESDSAPPSGRFVIVIVAELRFALSASVTSVFGASVVAPASSVKLAVVSRPSVPVPFRSTSGGALIGTTFTVAVEVAELTVPSLTTTVIERSVGFGGAFVLLYFSVRSTVE